MLRTTLEEWNADNATRLAAALAYYTLFSIAPILIIATAIAGLVLGRESVQGQLVHQIESYVNDPNTAALVQTMLKNASAPKTNIFATVVGIVVLLYGATNVFSELKSSLNLIWDVPLEPTQGVRDIIVNRFLALVTVMISGFLLLLSLVISTIIAAGQEWVNIYWPGMGMLTQVTNFFFFFFVTLFVFALIYKFLPDIKIVWQDVWIGAVATTLLFSIGRFLISLYLSHSTIQSTYGAAGSLAALLLWIYYSAQIFFLGAEFTQVYGRTKGSRQREEALLEEEPPPVPEELVEQRLEIEGSEGEQATGDVMVAPKPPPLAEVEPIKKPKVKQRPNLVRPLVDLVTAVSIIGVLSVVNLIRSPFRK
ncbi:MAG: YihY/virulence factor BrkB family protein [Chloroflexi bacterium]|nr:YihY/virulence factor BrkB family protein [Chloroflexota bacterium]